MRVCLLSARFPPQRCGVGDYTYFLAGALARLGHDVEVLTGPGDLDESLYPLPPNVQVHRVIDSWGTGGLPEILRYLRKLAPDLLVIQYAPHAFDRRGITFAINLLPVLARGSISTRIVTNFHELYVPFDRSVKRNLAALWQRAAAMLLASGSRALSVTASEWQRRLRTMGIRKRIQVIPVGSNIPLTTISEEDRARLRRRLLDRSDGVLVASFGARHDRDLMAALYGLQRLKTETPARLVWIGGGTLHEGERRSVEQAMDLNRLRAGDVEWTGELSHPEVSRVLGVCDLMVLPFVDGVSTRRTSAVTALRHGLPLLTTRRARQEPWFVHGENVYLVSTGNKQALADGLVELAQTPALRARLSDGARELYRARFAWHLIAEQVAELATAALSG